MDRLHCHIRPMDADDEGDLLLLAREVLQPLAESHGHAERYHDDEFLELIERADVYVALTAEEQGQVAGFVVVEDQEDDLVVRCLCVSPAHETQQVGHQLLDWAEGLAYDRGRARMAAEVPCADEHTQHLYASHAFSRQAVADRVEIVIMEKRLVDR